MLIHLYQLREGKQVPFIVEHSRILAVECAKEGEGSTVVWDTKTFTSFTPVSDSPAVVWAMIRRIQEAEFPNLRFGQIPTRE